MASPYLPGPRRIGLRATAARGSPWELQSDKASPAEPYSFASATVQGQSCPAHTQLIVNLGSLLGLSSHCDDYDYCDDDDADYYYYC